MRVWKRLPLALVVVLLGACQAATPPTAAPTAVTSAPAATTAAAASAANTAGYVVAHILYTSDPNQVNVGTGMTAEAPKFGWTVKSISINSISEANDAMVTAASQKVNAMVVEVFQQDQLSAGINAAQSAGIPVFLSLGTGQPTVPDVIGISGQAAGDISAEYLAQQMNGKGSVLAFTFQGGSPCVVNEKGFDTTMAKYPDISVTKKETDINSIIPWGQTTAAAWLLQHPAGSGNLAIWGCFDRPLFGAEAALKDVGRTDVKTYGILGEAQALSNVRDGVQTATWWFDTAAAGASIIDDLKQYFDSPSTWVPKYFPTEPVRLEASSIKDFLAAHPDLVK